MPRVSAFSPLVRQLRALPPFEPNPVWKQRTKRRLLAAYGELRGKLDLMRRWALYVTYDPDLSGFASSIKAKGPDWRPVAVNPERLADAVTRIQPSLVLIDPRLPRAGNLAAMVRARSMAETRIAAS